jgi:hypothetical protein
MKTKNEAFMSGEKSDIIKDLKLLRDGWKAALKEHRSLYSKIRKETGHKDIRSEAYYEMLGAAIKGLSAVIKKHGQR